MEIKSLRARYILILTVIFIILTGFITRLFFWQITDYDMYKDISGDKARFILTGQAVRGEIYDINGEPLAVNLTKYKVVLNRLFLDEKELNGIILRLAELTEQCGDKWTDKLPVYSDSSGKYRFSEEKQKEINELKDLIDSVADSELTAEKCMDILSEKYECKEPDSVKRRNIISVRYNMTKKDFSRAKPYVFAEEISEKTMSVISEKMAGVNGVSVEASAERAYINGSAAPHIVGVTGLISQEEYDELASKGYAYTDTIGKSGIESAFESELRGSPGRLIYEEEENGKVTLSETEPGRPGNSVYLTIDSKLQQVAQEALRDAVKEANEYAQAVNDEGMGGDCNGASVVVLDISDFSVLCAANYPCYDLSGFYEDYEKLASDSSAPLFDRAFAGALAPGSTFKPLVACAALEEKKISDSTLIECNGMYTENGLDLRCMGNHGAQDLEHAMMNSCNVFFAEAGRLLGIDKLNEYAKRFGLGVKTGVEIYESEGTLAGPEFSGLTGSEWYSGFVSQAAIGQSDLQLTPLQLATYCATIANGGKRLKTHVVDRITDYTGSRLLYKSKAESVEDTGISKNNLSLVQASMYRAACSYAALEGYPVKLAGKTGTAENSGSDHANFICYAPFDKPEIAIAVMVEHGAKSRAAIEVAKKILDYYYHF